LIKHLKKADSLYETYAAAKKSGGGDADDDIPEDEMAQFYSN
jgi:hypothetical protein